MSEMCACGSMNPGATVSPVASMTVRPSRASIDGAMRTTRSPRIATSRLAPFAPVPSITVPPRITTSYAGEGDALRVHAASASSTAVRNAGRITAFRAPTR